MLYFYGLPPVDIEYFCCKFCVKSLVKSLVKKAYNPLFIRDIAFLNCALQAEGHRFEPYNFHQKSSTKVEFFHATAWRAKASGGRLQGSA